MIKLTGLGEDGSFELWLDSGDVKAVWSDDDGVTCIAMFGRDEEWEVLESPSEVAALVNEFQKAL